MQARQRGARGRAPAGHQPPAEAPAARAHSEKVQRRDAERAREVRRRVPLLVQAGRRDQHDARHFARIRVRVQAGHNAAQGQTAQNQRILSRGFRREPLFWIDRIDRRRGAVQPPRRGPPDAPQHRAEAVRESQRVVIRELGEQRRAPVPREVQQEHVVAVAVAKLRGGVQPARVAHQPAVQEHDARAHAAQVRRASDLLPESSQNPRSPSPPDVEGASETSTATSSEARGRIATRAVPPLHRSALRARHSGSHRVCEMAFVSTSALVPTLALGTPKFASLKFKYALVKNSNGSAATANDLTRAPPRRGPCVASAPQSASHAPHARRRSTRSQRSPRTRVRRGRRSLSDYRTDVRVVANTGQARHRRREIGVSLRSPRWTATPRAVAQARGAELRWRAGHQVRPPGREGAHPAGAAASDGRKMAGATPAEI